VVGGVLEWVEICDPAEDDEFVERATAGIRAFVHAVVER
jgi:hypothetical protein